ncbi:hypothetical protein GYMLUDRAFT_36606 [Collybiopsis luxurians FD-317 M1]|nr:hypothetical protein GYMLUDRAFT_36606 [Collybiopsis luxurians FD-317 M1]
MSDILRSPGDLQIPLLKTSLNGLLLAVSLSLILFTYERAMVPMYASVPTKLHLPHFALSTLILPHILQFWSKARPISKWKWVVAGSALALAPNATYWAAIWTARLKDPYWGPAVVHFTVLVPLVFAIANCTVSHQDAPNFTYLVMNTIASFTAFPVATYLSKVLEVQPRMFDVTNSQILLVLSALAFSHEILHIDFATVPTPAPSSKPTKGQKKRAAPSASPIVISPLGKKLAALVSFNLFFFLSFYPRLQTPVLPDPLKYPITLPQPTADGVRVQILSSVQSTTGLIVVGEAMPPPKQDLEAFNEAGTLHSLRYLRAAHSLLGGVWFGPRAMTMSENDIPVKDSIGVVLGDSIYATFVLQEAARLVNNTQKTPENVLIIGLGTGIAATAFHRHNLGISIVEIDPAVYTAARKFFGLADPGQENVFLEDARGWAARKHAESQLVENQKLYDIVIHDCFSGGGVPEQLFTLEFLEDLKSVMHPEGVIAVNFAGHIISESSRLILRTLEKSFGGKCKAFFDSLTAVTSEQFEGEFMNVVFFCSRSPEPLTFRPAFLEDLLGSPLRRHILGTLHSREIDLSLLREGDEQDKANGLPDVITDANNPLGKMQEKKAHHHWQLMRDVLPDVFWETY